jgi:lycopene beta-cyclase
MCIMLGGINMETYEFLIAGGGGAGLGLAHALVEAWPEPPSILIIEKEAKNQNDRTWCFWGPASAPFTSLAKYSWSKLRICSQNYDQIIDLGDWRYWMVRGIDYYETIHHRLAKASSVKIRLGKVDRIEEFDNTALVTLGDETVAAHWVFDSILKSQDISSDTIHYHFLKQHFKGWEIESPVDIFDPQCATLFDFRTPQERSMRFFYILPFSPRHALVEFTLFSASLLPESEYDLALKNYLAQVLGLPAYTILAEEKGVIPMTDQPFQRRASPHVLNIGTKGGRVKPSTGYAFARMQQDALAIVDSLKRYRHPFALPRPPTRYRLFDSLMLQIMFRQGQLMEPIFLRLFERNPIQRIFRFLDENASLLEDAALISSLPPAPFLGALIRLAIFRRV